jgi:peptide/nickel transport system substrate-binding protein
VEVISQINETLFWQNEQGELEPLLATGFKVSPNGTTYTIPIRKGVKFSTGRPMTSADVVFSLEQAKKSPYYGALYEHITQIKASSPYTIVITTDEPVAGMKAILAAWVAGVVPDHYGGVSEKEFAQHPVGTGPFAFKSWIQGQSVTLARNPRYWQSGKPLLNEVVFHITPDDNSRTAQLRGGDLNVAVTPPFAQLASFEAPGSGFHTGPKPLLGTDNIVLNLNKPLFANPKVREAIDLAVNREDIVKVAMNGFGEAGAGILAPASGFADESLKPPAQDLAKAKSLLAEAVAEGVNPVFTIEAWSGATYSSVAAQVIQQDLKETGFTMKIEPLDVSAALANLEGGEFEAGFMSYIPAVADPTEVLGYLVPSVIEPSGGNAKLVAKLSSEAESELNETGRQEIYDKLQKAVAEERNMITLDYQPQVWVVQDSVQGLEQNLLNIIGLKDTGFGS